MVTSILDAVLDEKRIYEKRYKFLKSEVERLKDTDKKDEYLRRWGQMVEAEFVLYQFFKLYGENERLYEDSLKIEGVD